MAESFRGEVNQKVDGKARVSIPAAFRRVLESGDPSCPRKHRARNSSWSMATSGGNSSNAIRFGNDSRVEEQIARPARARRDGASSSET